MRIRRKKMNELTFCLPVRIDSNDRLNNLLTLLDYFSKYIIARYIILEADTQSKLQFLSTYSNVKYIYVEDSNPIFHRTKYINQMLNLTETPYAAIWDVDAIVPIKQLFEAYLFLQKDNKSIIVYPFDGKFIPVNSDFSYLFHKQKDIKLFLCGDMPISFMYGKNCVGGGFLVKVDLYKKCGWENENFIGWGPEDAERYRRMVILGHMPYRIDGVLYHLYHERGFNSGLGDDNTVYLTKKEFCKICAMSKDKLECYVSTWKWIK